MDLFIGRHRLWDAYTYPRVGQWPLPEADEKQLLDTYASLLVAAYATYESWKSNYYDLDAFFSRVKIEADQLPEKVYIVLGAHPEPITWRGEWAPYRLRIELEWWSEREIRPAFANYDEALDFAKRCLSAKSNSRFTVVELAVVN